MKLGIKKWSKLLNRSGVRLRQVVFTTLVCLGVGDEEEQEEEESVHSRYSRSSENQSGCSVAALFRINTCLFI